VLTEADTPSEERAAAPALRAEKITASYGRRQVLFDVTVRVDVGEVVCVVGHNGAGKTTLLNAIAGLISGGGTVDFAAGADRVAGIPSCLGLVPSDNCVFPSLSVRDNLRLGGRAASAADFKERFDRIVSLFPILEPRLDQAAGTMSGGEQRMLGLAIALMRRPSVLLLDEPSLGLSPAVANTLFEKVSSLAKDDGIAVLLVEQSIVKALAISDRALVIRSGHVIHEGAASELAARADIWELF
jgi:branched-chain amino acid transport system ATP-binding protein